MEVVSNTAEAKAPRRRKPTGRVSGDGQESVIDVSKAHDKEKHLVGLYTKQQEAAADFADAIKVVAEKSGLNASTVRAWVIAKAGENYDEKRRKVQQLSIIFEADE